MDQRDIWVINVEAVVSEYVLYPGMQITKGQQLEERMRGSLRKGRDKTKLCTVELRGTHEQEGKQREGKETCAVDCVRQMQCER